VIVCAGGDGRGWAANLHADPRCTLDIKGRRSSFVAESLTGEARDAAVADFVAAMGRTAGNTVWADVFVLRPAADPGAAAGTGERVVPTRAETAADAPPGRPT